MRGQRRTGHDCEQWRHGNAPEVLSPPGRESNPGGPSGLPSWLGLNRPAAAYDALPVDLLVIVLDALLAAGLLVTLRFLAMSFLLIQLRKCCAEAFRARRRDR